MSPTTQRPVTAVIVGCGHRALKHATYARERPDRLRIVGVADTLKGRHDAAAVAFGLPPDRCFESAEELASVPRVADAIINGTMDRQHVPTSLPLLAAGYDILLEKPIATSEGEMWDLVEARRRFDRKLSATYYAMHPSIRQSRSGWRSARSERSSTSRQWSTLATTTWPCASFAASGPAGRSPAPPC